MKRCVMTNESDARPRRNTKQRQLILNTVRNRCDHPTADAIYLEVHEADSHISRATVYRNLHLLAEEGEIQAVHVRSGDRFDVRTDLHPHVVCRECGAVMDVSMDYDHALDEEAARKTGYAIDSHVTFFWGVCPECRSRMNKDSQA